MVHEQRAKRAPVDQDAATGSHRCIAEQLPSTVCPTVEVPNAATQLTVQIHDGRAAGRALYSGAALQALHTPRCRRPKLACPQCQLKLLPQLLRQRPEQACLPDDCSNKRVNPHRPPSWQAM